MGARARCIRRSGEAVRKENAMEKSTTYTMLKIVRQRDFQNRDAVVSLLMTKEEYIAKQSIRLWRIPSRLVAMFLTAFMSSKA